MLQLQRASAGSGKTFTLAKKFIWLFITIKTGGNGTRRLRTRQELMDSVSHILAITFTNKATNEMKQRIVEKLAAIAAYTPGSGKKMPDYLEEFSKALNVDPSRVCQTCGEALRILLNQFGDFNVSTIDSFFQSVLRTFAYEVDLNDTYQVELDSNYLAKISIDETLEDVDHTDSPSSKETLYWIKKLMQAFPGLSWKWNIFQKYEPDPRQGSESSYSGLLKAVNKLQNEDYKLLRPQLDEYFAKGTFSKLYDGLQDKMDTELENLLKTLKAKAADFKANWEKEGLDLDKDGIRSLATSIKRIENFTVESPSYDKFTEANYESKSFCKDKSVPKEVVDDLRKQYREVCEAKHRLDEFLDSKEFRHWNVYRKNLPYLGLIKAVTDNREAFLQDNNLVELSETSSMLRRIIGNDDTPFIYERLGTRLNHFLIDEFQDTSLLQWENLLPLLHESMGRGNDNLIIGDAKQSIYRFRNADPSIINEKVPVEFPASQMEIRGSSAADNTNWRSSKIIVEFNNDFFRYLSARITPLGGSLNFNDLYSNVVQNIHNKADRGYVRVNFCESKGLVREKVSREIGPLIKSVVSRGYRMSEIAVLVSTRTEGSKIINDIIAYNAGLDETERAIEFISEESLRLSSSEAVKIIISVLENIVSGSALSKKDYGDNKKKLVWQDIKCDFKFFAMKNHGLTNDELLDKFEEGSHNDDRLHNLLSEMQSVALPSLVEAIAKSFVPESLRNSDAAYISALQDFVLDFCERLDADIPSFLQAWEQKGKDISISSPEGLDAVQVMTVHKSKGLEFKCVILPCLSDDYTESSLIKKYEWRWVKPFDFGKVFGKDFEMPPYMPVNTDSLLKGTIHEQQYNDFIDLKRMDFINSEYVAFTRAVDELYIYADCKMSKASSDKCNDPMLPCIPAIPQPSGNEKIGNYLFSWLKDMAESGSCPPCVEFDYDEDDNPYFTIGEKGVPVRKIDEDGSKVKEVDIDSYYVNTDIDFLKYKQKDAVMTDDDDPDPRSEGNLLHAVMENVAVASDLPVAVRKLLLKGIISNSMAGNLRNILEKAISDPRVKGWFDGSLKVINERPLLIPWQLMKEIGDKFGDRQEISRRPDRMMVDSEGNVTIVDYKFGEVRKDNRYRNQVRFYMELLRRSGEYKGIRGFLWYVRENVIEEVE